MQSVAGMARVDAALRLFTGAEDNFSEFWKRFQVVAKCQHGIAAALPHE